MDVSDRQQMTKLLQRTPRRPAPQGRCRSKRENVPFRWPRKKYLRLRARPGCIEHPAFPCALKLEKAPTTGKAPTLRAARPITRFWPSLNLFGRHCDEHLRRRLHFCLRHCIASQALAMTNLLP